MSITLEVGLLSGKTATVEVGLDEDVKSLQRRAEIALEVGNGRLLDTSGNLLASCLPIKEARVKTGDSLTLHVSRLQLSANVCAFAAILGDGSVVTWGDAGSGGDSSVVQHQLNNVQQIQATGYAFAAILGDGTVVSWGRAAFGGDSSAAQHQLKNVDHIQDCESAFAAILADGSVVTWGDAGRGSDSSAVRDQLKTVQQIQAAGYAFAAILGDGSVVTWGEVGSGGDSCPVRDQLKTVQQIQSTRAAFAAILCDGSVVTSGAAAFGGDSSAVQDQLKNVQQIQATGFAFAAILGDGTVVSWGRTAFGGDSSAAQHQLKNVDHIQGCESAFAAILADGSVVTWGDAGSGGDSSAVRDQLKTVQQIQATGYAFAAILGDGSVVTWGDVGSGGDSRAVRDQLKTVQQIQSTRAAFAAIRGDGSVVTWGVAAFGGDSSAVQDQLKNVQQIQATHSAFAAILCDGSVVTWGSAAALELPPERLSLVLGKTAAERPAKKVRATAGTSGPQGSVSDQLPRGAPRTIPTSALSAGLATRCSLKSKEDSERDRLAILWMGFADNLREDSCLLDDSSGLELQRLKPLFLDRAPSTLKRHLCGWKLWVSFCLTLDCRPGCPSLCQLLDFLDALSEGSFTERGRQRKRSALSVLSGMGFAAFKFQLSSLTKVLENPLVLAWKQADKWHRSRVKEALPLPLIVVQRLEAAVLGEPGEDRLLLCAILAMVWGSLRWSDVQRMALDSVVLDGGALMGWCWRTKSSVRGMAWAMISSGLYSRKWTEFLYEAICQLRGQRKGITGPVRRGWRPRVPLHRGTAHVDEALFTASVVLETADCHDASTDEESSSDDETCLDGIIHDLDSDRDSESAASSDPGEEQEDEDVQVPLQELEAFAGPWILNTVTGCVHKALWIAERDCWTLACRPASTMCSHYEQWKVNPCFHGFTACSHSGCLAVGSSA
ncbi:hypothetical protein AK812_SmicGene10361 [Symbiodinium microadriaticum]|uniref:E3 ubiquitin-protein ligase HERC2 n=1 Tax=Symbiodinium microadriaticum TaxID=2951 RepID=A0A1Q9EG42_SYMMI|nr:hypothetical protein AK812_SmicGene10361 [Symbiodinium microadriaticum]